MYKLNKFPVFYFTRFQLIIIDCNITLVQSGGMFAVFIIAYASKTCCGIQYRQFLEQGGRSGDGQSGSLTNAKLDEDVKKIIRNFFTAKDDKV